MSCHRPLTAEAIRRLTLPTDPWLSCDDCFDQANAAVENVLDRTGTLDESFRVHLLACSVCYDEATSLVQLVAPDFMLDESQAAEMLAVAVRTPGVPAGGTA